PEVVREPEPEREDSPKKEEGSGEKSLKNLKEPERSWSETLMRCRSVLRLSCAEMAFLFDVSPEKFYSWFGDDGPDIEQEVLLQYCVEVAKRVEKTEIPRFDLAIRNAFSDGDSFVQKLKRQKITGEDLKILKDAAQRDEELRRRPKGATKPFHSFQDTIDLYSTPLYCEV
ncbi:MAG: hypothetical protein LBT15_05220, partial [Synergistaceae bacterium]|nr:hypothetical protein [Synergistaceae bacterium]